MKNTFTPFLYRFFCKSSYSNMIKNQELCFAKDTAFNLNALVITETELKLIAAAANIGESNRPKNGYNKPAATGTPTLL